MKISPEVHSSQRKEPFSTTSLLWGIGFRVMGYGFKPVRKPTELTRPRPYSPSCNRSYSRSSCSGSNCPTAS